MNPQHSKAYNSRGNCYLQNEQYDVAITDHNKAIELDPQDSYAYYNRGLDYYRKGEYLLAINDYNNAVHLNPSLAQAYYGKVSIFVILGRTQEAIDTFKDDGANIVKQRIQELGGII
jgi:tetratricopeptide (TPR) repeat protein